MSRLEDLLEKQLAKLDLIANILAYIKEYGMPLSAQITTQIAIEDFDKLLSLFMQNYPPDKAIGIDIAPEPQTISPNETVRIIDYENPSDKALFLYFGQSLNDTDGFDYIEWWIYKNESPIEPYNPLIGNVSSVYDSELMKFAVPIVLDKGDKFAVVVKNTNSAISYVVTARVKGWRWNL